MKTLKVRSLQFFACFVLVFSFISCKKSSCGKTSNPEEFINYTIDGTNHSYIGPSDTLKQFSLSQESNTFVVGVRIGCYGQDGNYTDLTFSKSNISVNSEQPLSHFGTTAIFGSHNVLLGLSNVRITEYGAIGEFISGNFTGVLSESQNQAITHTVVCNFRVRRVL